MSSLPPIYSAADESRAWEHFAAPADSADFYRSWLAILCGQVTRAEAAMLLLAQGEDAAFAPVAIWPEPLRDMHYLVPVAQRALQARQGVVERPGGEVAAATEQRAYVAYPVESEGRLHAAVALDIAPGPAASLQAGLRQVHWAIAWLVAEIRRQHLAERDTRLGALAAVTDLMATTLQDRRFGPSALALVNELCARGDTAHGRACGRSACVLCYVLANLLLCVPGVRRVL